MNRLLRVILAGLLVLPATCPLVGCGKDEAKPNQDLKVPDVPPGNRGGDKSIAPAGPKKQ